MWNEPSTNLSGLVVDPDSSARLPFPAEIDSVEKDSIAEELGFEPGDKLISINGKRPRDLIDYRFLVGEEQLHIEVLDSVGELHKIDCEKEIDDSLGLIFKDALFDGLRQCNNNCPFCFIDQQPSGKRKTLYLKDDDYRMSFLYGSYLTLTNLLASDWQRIEMQRLSPLYVSVHSTDPKLRSKLLRNKRAVLLMEQLAWFDKRNLQIHAQVVVCPGLNDGSALNKTLNELAFFGSGSWPAVISVAIVPVGLTRFRPDGDGLIPVDSDCARKVIIQVEKLQSKFQDLLGTRFAWLSDEWYLLAGYPLPRHLEYEDFSQQENGVGSIRAFLEDLDEATENLPETLINPRRSSWVVGSLVKEVLAPACGRLNAVDGLSIHLYGLRSPYWGQDQVVTGLLTGQDVLAGLKGKDLGDQLLLPSVMLRSGNPVFLDDMTLHDVSNSLGVPITVVNGAADIVAALIGELQEVS